MSALKSDFPRLSIVVTCFNLEKYIEESLTSVIQQDYPGCHEIIIVDDCSTDRSVEIMKRIIAEKGAGKEISLICNEQNLGVAGATDIGWQKAKYEWIIEVDGDDVQLTDRCSKTADIIRKYPMAGLIVMSHSLINADGIEYGERLCIHGGEENEFLAWSPAERVAVYKGDDASLPVCRGAFGCSMCLNKKLIEKWGALSCVGDERFAQDPPWELRAFLSFPVVWSNCLACKYRSHESNILNRMRRCITIKDFIRNELEMCKYAGKEVLALEQMLRDLNRALQEERLSDWGRSDILNCLQGLQRDAFTASMRNQWWSYSIFKRIYLVFRMADKFSSNFRSWFKLRIMPCSLAMTFKWFMKVRRSH